MTGCNLVKCRKGCLQFSGKKDEKEPAKIHFTSVSVRSDVFPNALTKPRHSERLHTETHSW